MELLKQVMANKDNGFLETMSTHQSDIVRCWATYTIGRNANLTLQERFEKIAPLASDKHFGVREISWLAVRKAIICDLEPSLAILSMWTTSKDENIRRFATEATRPRGVWCEHIVELKKNPELGLRILEPLKSDGARYVQDSVGNWLNDASKSHPEFVKILCKRWEKESDTRETKYIIKKALRTLQKKSSISQ